MDRLDETKAKLNEACRKSNRSIDEITLIAVSKTFEEECILPVLNAGQRVFGENRVQESQKKWPSLKAEFSDVELHLIGPLQSNKAGDAVALFDVIHTVDRDKIARLLANEVQKQNRKVEFFIQVNTGAEPQKAGILPQEVDDFVKRCSRDYGLTIEGLMAIPPVNEEASTHFKLLKNLAGRNGLRSLSMGMSADFTDAIEEGATHIRVGSAIFGERAKPV